MAAVGAMQCRAGHAATFAHPQLPKDICALLGIVGLEDAVFEVLDQSEPLEFVDSLQVWQVTLPDFFRQMALLLRRVQNLHELHPLSLGLAGGVTSSARQDAATLLCLSGAWYWACRR